MAAVVPFLPAIASVGASAASGIFGRSKPKETKIQKKQRELVDQLLASLNGNGPYSNLFTASDEDFERSFAAPARSRFRNETAPQIQQSYIAEGQQRSTGLEDKLARAGVDMDSLLNKQYFDYKQGAQNRQVDAIGKILGQGAGPQKAQGVGESALQGVSGYLSGDSFGSHLQSILDSFNSPSDDNTQEPQVRKGFEN